MKWQILFFAVLSFSGSLALGEDECQNPENNQKQEDRQQIKKTLTKDGMSFVPLIVANSTYGVMGGVLSVFQLPLSKDYYTKSKMIILASSKKQFFLGADFEGVEDRWIQGVMVSGSNFFDSYYRGDGRFHPEQPDEIQVEETKLDVYRSFRHNSTLSTKFSWLQRSRKEKQQLYFAQEKRYASIQLFPNEKTNAFAIGTVYEDLKETDLSPLGHKVQISALIMPGGAMSSIKGQEQFSQFSLDLRWHEDFFAPLFSCPLVFSSRIYAGSSNGKASYLFKYRLGGHLLRGYRYGRFRGDRIYAFQEELRFPVWSFVSGSVFIEAGEASEDRFQGPLLSSGVGIKLALPPDYVAKIRFDVGFSAESINLMMQANHAF